MRMGRAPARAFRLTVYAAAVLRMLGNGAVLWTP